MRKPYAAAAVPIAALLVIIGVAASLPSLPGKSDELAGRSVASASNERNRRCTSQKTYAAIQRELFRQAAETRGSNEAAFGQISNYSIVRMEQPIVRGFDEELATLRCSGKLFLQLPRGIAVVGGRHALAAEVDYVLQPAADGSGDVVMLEGQAPITIPLATLARSGSYSELVAASPAPDSTQVAMATPVPAPLPAPAPAPAPAHAPAPAIRSVSLPPAAVPPRPVPPVRPAVKTATVVPKPTPVAAKPAPAAAKPAPAVVKSAATSAKPSFNCRYARTRGEISVCRDSGLASLDRRMASNYYRAVASASASQREALRSSRNSFLRKRDRCTSEACVAASYEERIGEISAIATR